MSKKSSLAHIGVVGLGPMGASLAQNIESRGYTVAVYNRNYKKTAALMSTRSELALIPTKSYKALVQSIKRPRKVMIMVKAGPAVDAVIKSLLPHLEKGDVIMDGGNSYYKDTQRRFAQLKAHGIYFIGCGVSGGEEGALHGPSLMPGGSKVGYKKVSPILSAIAAKDFQGNPCVTYVGDNAAGHYIKMVHNGIEYGIMQLLAETYDLLRKIYNMSATDIAAVFKQLQKNKLQSYLFDIVIPVLEKKDDLTKKQLVDVILDQASNKGTGKWTAIDALDRGIAIPTITDAVYARYLSTDKLQREQLQKKYKPKYTKPRLSQKAFIGMLEDALYAAIVSTFAQGFDLIQNAAKEEKWNISSAEVSRIWQGGCIIRTTLLQTLHTVFLSHDGHLFLDKKIQKHLSPRIKTLQQLTGTAIQTGVPVTAFSSSLYYIESMIASELPANVIQGLRDYFGAHTYERTDKPGSFHTQWTNT